MSRNPMKPKILRPDSKGRITLGALAQGVSGYQVTETKEHNILLEPLTEIPAREKWLFDNKIALAKVEQGICDAENNKFLSKGSFSEFEKEDIE